MSRVWSYTSSGSRNYYEEMIEHRTSIKRKTSFGGREFPVSPSCREHVNTRINCNRIRVAATHSRFYEMVVRVGRSLNGWRVRFDVKTTNGFDRACAAILFVFDFINWRFRRVSRAGALRPNEMFDFDVQRSVVTSSRVSLPRWPTTLPEHFKCLFRVHCPIRLFSNRRCLPSWFYIKKYYFSFRLSKRPRARFETPPQNVNHQWFSATLTHVFSKKKRFVNQKNKLKRGRHRRVLTGLFAAIKINLFPVYDGCHLKISNDTHTLARTRRAKLASTYTCGCTPVSFCNVPT